MGRRAARGIGGQRKRSARRCLFFELLEERHLLSATVVTQVSTLSPTDTSSALQPGTSQIDYFSHVVFDVDGNVATPDGAASPPIGAVTPAQIRHAYGIDQIFDGGVLQDGTGMTVAIIDAFDNPRFVSRNGSADVNSDLAFLASDLHKFDLQFGLPEPAGFFTKVNQSGGTSYPVGDTGWGTEIALDVEWVHAVAPGARIVLVEAVDSTDANLIAAAGAWARDFSGAAAITMSFGRSEGALQDSVFHSPADHGVTWLASTGDDGAPGGYPAFSPNVLAVGGTTLSAPGGVYSGEVGWNGSGGGVSVQEAQPAYQTGLVIHSGASIISPGGHRAIPDVSFDADPASGAAVYDSFSQGSVTPWLQVGGTSFSSPAWAGLIAIANELRANHALPKLDGLTGILPNIYDSKFSSHYHDVVSGSNGFSAAAGYDLVTGLGTPTAQLIRDISGIGNLTINSSTPANGEVTMTQPTEFTVTFSNAIDPASLQGSDLTVNSIPASSAALSPDGKTATFTYVVSPVTAEGLQTMGMAAGAVRNSDDATTTSAAFTSTFRYDALLLQVTATNPPAGGLFALPAPFTYDVTFNEPIDPTSVSTNTLVLSGIAGATVTNATVLPGNTTARFTINGISVDGGLGVSIVAGSVKDQFGNPSGEFSADYFTDVVTSPFPVPLTGDKPDGSLVYEGSASSAIGPVADEDRYTITLDPQQTITVDVLPTDGTLQPVVTLFDPLGATVATASAGAAGQGAIIQTAATTVATSGLYTISVTGAGGTTGRYAVRLTLNTAREEEGIRAGASDDGFATAQNIDGSFVSLGGSASRGAVLGRTESGQSDCYAMNLSSGDMLSAAIKAITAGTVHVSVYGPSGALVATAIGGATNVDQVLRDLVVPVSGLYRLEVFGDPSVDYNLVATRNAAFDSENNDAIASAQPLESPIAGGEQHALGAVSASGDLFALRGTPVTGSLILTGAKVTLGINTDGSFIIGSTGIQFLGTEFVVPGTPVASFTVGYNGNTYTNNLVNGISQIVIASKENLSLGSRRGVRIVGTAGDNLKVERIVVFNDTDEFVTVATRVTNLSVSGLLAVATLENLDPDQGSSLGLTANTNNDVVLGGQLVRADVKNGTYPGGLTIGLGSTDPRRVVSAEGFDNRNPFDIINSPEDPNGAPGDIGIALAVNLGTLAPSASSSTIHVMTFGRSTTEAETTYTAHAAGTSINGPDIYRIQATAGVPLSFTTRTPGDGLGEPINNLDPKLRLLDSSGNQVAAGDNGAADGRNALLNYAPPASGVYYVEVSAAATSGEYELTGTGAGSPAGLSFHVTGVSPAPGSVFRAPPTAIVLEFNDAIFAPSVDAFDLLIDGSPFTGAVTQLDGDTLSFAFPALEDGLHTLSFAAGSILDVQQTPLDAFSSSFTLSTKGPRVTATSLAPAGVLSPGALSYQVTFDRPMRVANLSTDDFSLRGNLLGVDYSATSFSYNVSGTVLTLNYTSLPEDNYTLNLVSGVADGFNFVDTAGNALDGEFTGVFPSGDGVAGGDFAIGFALDKTGSEAYPTPLVAKAPLGSVVYDPSISRLLTYNGDTDSFTLSLAPGQQVSAVVTPATGSLQPTLELRDLSNAVLGTVTAAAAGQRALLNTLATGAGGTFTFSVSDAAGAIGQYTLQVTLGAALEAENYDGASNDSFATAQNIDGSFASLGSLASRGAVLGRTEAGHSDWYALSLNSGDTLTLAAKALSAGTIGVSIYDPSGALVATALGGATNFDRLLSDLVIPVSGLYRLEIIGDPNVDYNLVATRNAAFDTEGNDTLAAAQYLNAAHGVLGYIGSGGGGPTARVGYFTDGSTSDTGPQAPILAAGYTPVQIVSIGTFDLSTIDILMVDESSNDGLSSTLTARLPMIQAWVQAGGVFVVHDRFVGSGGNPLLIGAPGAVSHRDFAFDTDLNVIPPGGTLVTSGPFGTINDTSLDGGTSSDHGYVDGATLPGSSTKILSAGPNVSHVSTFSYTVGAGTVYYSTIPLDFYLNNTGTISATLRNVYTPNVLVYANSKRSVKDDDWYSLTVVAPGDQIKLATSTPGDGGGAPNNALAPVIELYNPSGSLAAIGAVGADGRNESLSYTAPVAGRYRVHVAAVSGTKGEYFLAAQFPSLGDYNVDGVVDAADYTVWGDALGATSDLRADGDNDGIVDAGDFDVWRRHFGMTASPSAPSFHVTTVSPVSGAVLRIAPTSLVVDFNDAIFEPSVDASDLLIDGVPFTGTVTQLDGDTLSFAFPALEDGPHVLTFAAGSILDVQQTPLDSFTSSFTLSTKGPRVTATSVAPSGVLPPGALSYQLTFDRAMKVANLSTDDFSLRGNLLGVNYSPASYSYDPSGTVLTLNYTALPEDNYTLTLVSGVADGSNFTDAAGNQLDGEFTGTLPSGDGVAGGNFAVGFALDATGPELFPTPAAKSPLGSLVYDSSVSRAIAYAGDVDSFTIAVAPGQTLSVVATPTDAALQPSIQILDPSNSAIGGATALGAGQAALLNTTPTTSGGVYTIVVTGAEDTIGRYAVRLTLNASQEEEGVLTGVTNDTLATAQSIDASFLHPSNTATGVLRGSVVGASDAAGYDVYSFSLTAGDGLTLALAGNGTGNLNLLLQDAAGATLATGTAGATNLNQKVSQFVVPTSGTYYARISSDAIVNYCLVVTRNADFDTELNDTHVAPQSLDGARGVLGHVQSLLVPPTTRVGYYTDFNTFDTGPQTPIVTAGYTPVQITDISTFNFSTIDILMVDEPSNSGISSTLSARLPAIQTWVQGGGVFVVHDRFVAAGFSGTNPLLIGAPGAIAHHDSTYGADLNVIPPGDTLVTNGPFGSISNATLDGGTSSDQGWVDAFTLPSTTVPILSAGPSVSNVASFSYEAGAGTVYYSTIPLDYYLDGSGPTGLMLTMKNVYTPNVLAYANGRRKLTDDDWYSINIPAGNRVTLGTSTPGDGGGAPGNTLVPRVELYNPSGGLAAVGAVVPDGRNVSLSYTAAAAGLYRVHVSAASNTLGDYFLSAQSSSFPAGDYNHNGVVDAADYTVWRDTLGSATDLRANGENNGSSAGLVDQADYTYWRAYFGATSAPPSPGSSASLTTETTNEQLVPEPAKAVTAQAPTLTAFDLALADWESASPFTRAIPGNTNASFASRATVYGSTTSDRQLLLATTQLWRTTESAPPKYGDWTECTGRPREIDRLFAEFGSDASFDGMGRGTVDVDDWTGLHRVADHD
jgi:Bacterial pre-peptidase C-terminal domain